MKGTSEVESTTVTPGENGGDIIFTTKVPFASTTSTDEAKTVTFKNLNLNEKYTLRASFDDKKGIYDVGTFANGVNDVCVFASLKLENHHTFKINRNQDSYKGKITVANIDIDDNAKAIGESKYALYKSDGTLIEEKTTDLNGKVEFTGLDINNVKYYIKETLPGLGYKLNTFENGNEDNPNTIEVLLETTAFDLTETVKSKLIEVEIPKIIKTNQDNFDSDKAITVKLMKGTTEVESTTVTPTANGADIKFNMKVPFSSDEYSIEESAQGFAPVKLNITMSDNRAVGKVAPYDKTDVTIIADALSGGELAKNADGVYTLMNKRNKATLTADLKDIYSDKMLGDATYKLYDKDNKLVEIIEASGTSKTVKFKYLNLNEQYTLEALFDDKRGIYDVDSFSSGSNNVHVFTAYKLENQYTFKIDRKKSDLKVVMYDFNTIKNQTKLKLKNATITLVKPDGTEESKKTADGANLGEVVFNEIVYDENYTVKVEHEGDKKSFEAINTDGKVASYIPSLETWKTRIKYGDYFANNEVDVYADTGTIGSIKVVKKWETTDEPIAGAKVSLMQAVRHHGKIQPRIAGGVVFEEVATGVTDTNGEVNFDNLIIDVEYKVVEVEDTNNPLGKPLDSEIFTPTIDNPNGEHILVIKPETTSSTPSSSSSSNSSSSSSSSNSHDGGYYYGVNYTSDEESSEESSSSQDNVNANADANKDDANKAGDSSLPKTGEGGNLIYYIIGAILVLMGGSVLFYSLKMKSKKK